MLLSVITRLRRHESTRQHGGSEEGDGPCAPVGLSAGRAGTCKGKSARRARRTRNNTPILKLSRSRNDSLILRTNGRRTNGLGCPSPSRTLTRRANSSSGA